MENWKIYKEGENDLPNQLLEVIKDCKIVSLVIHDSLEGGFAFLTDKEFKELEQKLKNKK